MLFPQHKPLNEYLFWISPDIPTEILPAIHASVPLETPTKLVLVVSDGIPSVFFSKITHHNSPRYSSRIYSEISQGFLLRLLKKFFLRFTRKVLMGSTKSFWMGLPMNSSSDSSRNFFCDLSGRFFRIFFQGFLKEFFRKILQKSC